MCGRSRCSLAPDAVSTATGIPQERWKNAHEWQPKYNLAPGGWVPVVKLGCDGQPEIQAMKWGLIPSFTKAGDKFDFWRMFNARSEGLATSPVFRRLLPTRRCVVLLNGFYEWKQDAGNRKQPYYVYLTRSPPATPAPPSSTQQHAAGEQASEVLLPVAALWDEVPHGGESGGPLATVTLVTTDSCPELRWLHDRMPVLLRDADAIRAWLGADLPTLQELAPQPTSSAPVHTPRQASDSSHSPLQGSAAADHKVKGGEAREQGGEDHQAKCAQLGEGVAAGECLAGEPGSSSQAGKEQTKVDVGAMVEKLCVPYPTPSHGSDQQTGSRPPARLAWHPVTPDMTRLGMEGPVCCKDVRAAKGTIASFFAPKPRQGAGAATGAGVGAGGTSKQVCTGVVCNTDEQPVKAVKAEEKEEEGPGKPAKRAKV
mmetsp:Transcript_34575/g.87445  ORF Transcript_34575/g.87445 Transcript_34575/m.87445 type:complete len:427 (-) Transcript_34575:92-1372(-)